MKRFFAFHNNYDLICISLYCVAQKNTHLKQLCVNLIEIKMYCLLLLNEFHLGLNYLSKDT